MRTVDYADGDARKAMNLLRISAELAERENTSKVEEKHESQHIINKIFHLVALN